MLSRARREPNAHVPPASLRGRVVRAPGRSTLMIEIVAAHAFDWRPSGQGDVGGRSVPLVEQGTTRPGTIMPGTMVRAELAIAFDHLIAAGRVEIVLRRLSPDRGARRHWLRRCPAATRLNWRSGEQSWRGTGTRSMRWFSRYESRFRPSLQSFAATVDIEGVVQRAALLIWERTAMVLPDGRHAIEPDGEPDIPLPMGCDGREE